MHNENLADTAKRAIGLLDLTTLTGEETEAEIISLCERAQSPRGSVAAICVYNKWVPKAKEELAGTGIRIATVANFPDGSADVNRTVEETKLGLEYGADEVDIVFPWKTWLAGDHAEAVEVVKAARAAVPARKILKVIIETGQLGGAENIRAITSAVIDAGADFVKTSTGKTDPAATPEAAQAILEEIKRSGKDVGFKASGGIRTTAEAATYLAIADELFGQDWVNETHFRIGASSVLTDLLAQLGAETAEKPAATAY
jgi:deoxyribose-phosphate aldolase